MSDELSALVRAVLAVRDPDEWNGTLERFGAQLMADPHLRQRLAALIPKIHGLGREDEARTLQRWYDEMTSHRVETERFGQALRDAENDADIDRVLGNHPSYVTPQLVDESLTEIRRLLSDETPIPPDIAVPAVRRLLGVSLRIAVFLRDEELEARCRLESCRLAFALRQPETAAAELRAAARLWRSVGNMVELGRCLSLVGDAMVRLDRRDEALTALKEAVEVLREAGAGGDALLGPTYHDIATLLSARGDMDQALEFFDKAIRHRLSAGQIERALPLLPLVISNYAARGDTGSALPHAEILIDLLPSRTSGNEVVISDLATLSRACLATKVSHALAEGAFLSTDRSVGPRGDKAEPGALTLPSPGGARYEEYIDRDALAEAERWYAVADRAHALAPTAEGSAALDLLGAHLGVLTGNVDRAAGQARAALRHFEQRNLRAEAASALSALAQAERRRGRPESAVAACDRALRHTSPDSEWGRRPTWLITRAEYQLLLGRPEQALESLREAIRLCEGGTSREQQADCGSAHHMLGMTYAYLGDVQAALTNHHQAWAYCRLLGHRRGEAATLHALGVLLGRLGQGRFGKPRAEDLVALQHTFVSMDPTFASTPIDGWISSTATRLLHRAETTYQEINDQLGRTKVMTDLANFLPPEENPRRIDILTEVLARKKAVGDELGTAVVLANLGSLYHALDRQDEAAQAFEDSLRVSRGAEFFESAADASYKLGLLRQEQNHLAVAEACYSESVRMIEAARCDVPLTDRYRVNFVRDKARPYGRLVDILVARECYDEAFELVQRAKSRALLEMAGTTTLRPVAPRTGRFAELLGEEEECLSRLRADRFRSTSRAPGPFPATTTSVRNRLDALYTEMTAFDPDYVSLRRGTPSTVAEVRTWLAAQRRPVLLVDYFLSDERLTLFFLRAEWDSVRVATPPMTPGQLSEGCRDFQRQVVDYRNTGSASWTRLSTSLTEPLAPHVRSGDLVYLVPHGPLHGLPLHALPFGSAPALAAAHPVAYTPTAGLLPLAQNPAKGTGRLESCAAFGVVFEQEAREVARLFGAEAIVSDALRVDDVPRLCRGKDICHFSCHGYFNSIDPLSSGLLLADEDPGSASGPMADVMTARHIMNMELRAELVCLSACQSAVSDISTGDELVGLIRAVLYAGAASIVASLWSVDAHTTREMMTVFYRHLRDHYRHTGTIDKASALQQAQREMIRQVGPRSSFQWAPFVLIGDWR
ncbi:CHAT domain-containing protein [Streptomyces mirabilis]|uniref:CHAT domain-containing protein n=1 Tax=Streptomyces mirabilis TaxID=68239 RepID=UPI0021C17FB1|nr:CHAT domain-containing tetratricopeptide repeat protein [Streptomyces mirabilis]MCT9113642.1 CHAT domain-containing protein [Streptomyces mirabilis]